MLFCPLYCGGNGSFSLRAVFPTGRAGQFRTLFQNVVQIRCRQPGNIIQTHLLQTLQYGFAYAFDGKQGLDFFIGERHFVFFDFSGVSTKYKPMAYCPNPLPLPWGEGIDWQVVPNLAVTSKRLSLCIMCFSLQKKRRINHQICFSRRLARNLGSTCRQGFAESGYLFS